MQVLYIYLSPHPHLPLPIPAIPLPFFDSVVESDSMPETEALPSADASLLGDTSLDGIWYFGTSTLDVPLTLVRLLRVVGVRCNSELAADSETRAVEAGCERPEENDEADESVGVDSVETGADVVRAT